MESEGWDALKPAEMVELALYPAVPRQDLSKVARLLVDRFGSIGGVFSASREALSEVPGVTDALAEWIDLTGGLMRAYYDLQASRDIRLGCYQELLAFLKDQRFAACDVGQWALYADFDFNFITCDELGPGDWWEADNARKMVAGAIGSGARYVYLAIRRDGAPPEMGDWELARLEALAVTLRAVGMDLVDCALLDGGQVRSMNLLGRMNAIRAASGCMDLHERYADPGASDDGGPV